MNIETRKDIFRKQRIIDAAPEYAEALFNDYDVFTVRFTPDEWDEIVKQGHINCEKAIKDKAKETQAKNTPKGHITGLAGEMTVLRFTDGLDKSTEQYAKIDIKGRGVPVHVKSINDFLHPKWQVLKEYSKTQGLYVFVYIDLDRHTGTIYGIISQEDLVQCPIEKNYFDKDNYTARIIALVPTNSGDTIPVEDIYNTIKQSPYHYDGSGQQIRETINRIH